ncbi:ankyrin-3-like isoform X3 [Photinus pyralis]|nr:ankyrin-3-like isoform X3 [Photinus pyralis]
MGCMNIVIYLLQHEANPDVPTVRGESSLHLAARANQTDIIRILLRNGAAVDAKAREEQTPLHVAARLGNVDIVMLLLQHGANPHASTKDLYTPLHIAAKEGQEEVAFALLDNGADLSATTKKGFTPLHLAAKYGHLNVARLLLQRDAPADTQGKNGVTPLHVAAHYDHQPIALLLLDKGASPHAVAKNGHTPLHIAARKNQMDIATTLLEYGAQPDAESKAGFTPLHLSAQEGHSDMSSLLLEHHVNPSHAAKNGLTPLHLCAQEDRVPVAQLLLRAGAPSDSRTKSNYTPLHVACHNGHVNMVRLLIEHGAEVNPTTTSGYTPLHQAAQQGHVLVINLLLKNRADPNAVTNNGQTALGIANKLGYISVVEELKVVTETNITTTTTINIEEKYKVVAPEAMQETFMSDSEDEGGIVDEPIVVYGRPVHAQHVYMPFYQGNMNYTSEDPILGDQQQYKYMTMDDMKSLADDGRMDVTNDEKSDNRISMAPSSISDYMTTAQANQYYAAKAKQYQTESTVADNVDINRQPITVGFLVSFLVDARGGAMRGCRHSGVRVIVPPQCAASPTRITCRYVRPQRITNPPPLMEGEALASRVLELGPVGAKFLGPVILEVPHFASLRGKQREIIVLRSDNGETWKEHTLESSEEAIQDVLNHSFEGEELNQIEDLHTSRITRILTNDFPHYFAIVSRIRQEVHAIGPEGGTVSSSAVPLVQAVFPQNALTKKIRVGLQAQAIEPETVAKLLGHGVAVSPVVTVEPRRRKFHKAIMLSMPAPRAHSQGMINQYSGSAPTLRLLCSITGGQNKAVWEDVTGSTPLSFVKDCVSFTTTVSARFWLMDCRNVSESARMATELYTHHAHVPFMAKFVVFAKRISVLEARVRVFCMTDDKEEKTLEHQEQFTEIAKSRDIEVLEGKDIYMEFSGNLVPILQSDDQPKFCFQAFRENRLAFTMRLRDADDEATTRIVFKSDPKVARGEPTQIPLCTLNLVLPKDVCPDRSSQSDLLSLEKDHSYLHHGGISKPDTIHRADFRLSDICNLLDDDWEKLAAELDIPPSDVQLIKGEYSENKPQQAMIMFRLWLRQKANKATGNQLEQALNKIGRQDIVEKCICNVELVTDDMERALARLHLDQSGFETFKDELGPSRDNSLHRGATAKKLAVGEDDLDFSQQSGDQISLDKDMADTLSDYLAYKKEKDARPVMENNIGRTVDVTKETVIEALAAQLNNLEATPGNEKSFKTPPPSPEEFKNEQNDNEEKFVNDDMEKGLAPQVVTSTPIKSQAAALEVVDPVAQLKQNVSDTLTFLHKERNDFLPLDDIIIPSRKDDHVAKDIDLSSESIKKRKVVDLDNVRASAESEVDKVIEAAETAVNEVVGPTEQFMPSKAPIGCQMRMARPDEEDAIAVCEDMHEAKRLPNSSQFLDNEIRAINLNSAAAKIEAAETAVNEFKVRPTELFKPSKAPIGCQMRMVRPDENIDAVAICEELYSPDKQNAILEAQEVFKFLENEATPTSLPNSSQFLENEIHAINFNSATAKSSGIPVPKPRQKIAFSDAEREAEPAISDGERSISPDEFLSKIPVSGKGKVKTIKKHSKDPLKEFVKLTQDVNWDDDQAVTTTDPIVKTTVTRITMPDDAKTGTEYVEVSKSKIPVLMTESTRILPPDSTPAQVDMTLVSPGSDTKFSTKSKSSTLDSDSDSDSRRSSPLKGILKKSGLKLVGSSSGSDIALHEAGSELSEDESEDFCQNDQPQFTETTVEEVDPVTGAKITRTTRTVTQSTTMPGAQNESDLRQSIKEVLDQFMSHER